MKGRIHSVLVALAMSGAIMLPASGAFGQDRDVERRIANVQEQIHATINKGEELLARGRTEQAHELFARTDAMQAELHAWMEQLEREAAALRGAEQERRQRDDGHFINVIEHLEHAMMILKEHGNTELAMQIDNVANQIRKRVDGREREGEPRQGRERSERDIAQAQIETLQMALNVLREAERGDAADLVHRAIRAREVGLEGRRDEEARQIRERSPSREQTRRMLGIAIEQYQEFGAHDRAEMLARAVRELFPQPEQDRVRERERERAGEGRREEPERETKRAGRSDREHLAHQIEIMRMAMPAIREAGRVDTAELLEHAIHARELMLEGVRGEKAVRVIETAPQTGSLIEILGWASRLWDEFGNHDKAEMLGNLAQQMRHEWRQEQERENPETPVSDRGRESGEADRQRREQTEALERRLTELEAALEHTRAQLRELRGGGIR